MDSENRRRKQEAEFTEQERIRRKTREQAEEAAEAARRAQEEYARRKAYSDAQRESQENTTPPPLPEEIRFARTLELKGKITKEDIKRRYRDLVHKYHPDKVSHLGDEFKELAHRKFKEINEAYEYFRKKYEIN